MNFLILLLLALKSLRVFAFNYPHNIEQNSNEVDVVNYNDMGQGTCPKIKQPLCATNGVETLYFDNKCFLEVKNFEQLMQGLQEFYECPLSYCSPQCAPCGHVYEPVCAIDVLSGQMENYQNPCEVERKICFSQRDHRIISSGECSLNSNPQSKCPQYCTLDYSPVCAQLNAEFREFSNQCQLHKERCETNNDWQIVDATNCAALADNSVSRSFKSFSQNSECPEFCTLEYQPICARFMTLEKEFSNECELKTTICQTKQKWNIIRHGPCQESQENTALNMASNLATNLPTKPKCPEFCTLEYSPICAKFLNELREFANRCELETIICNTKQEWQIIENGPCPRAFNNKVDLIPTKSKCPLFCTLEYNPICAKFQNELREFPNKCQLESTICETEQEWQIVLNGPCPSSGLDKKFSETSKCPQFCTLEYNPICAKFHNELREFPNKCQLENTKCETEQEWQIVSNGPCRSGGLDNKAVKLSGKSKCPQFCTLEYRPICAKFNNELREFSNNCDLESTICETNDKWEIVRQGTCSSSPALFKTKCPKVCTLEYRPICAKFNNVLREFSNNCDLESTICQTNEKWEVVKQGKCFSEVITKKPKCPQVCTFEYRPICARFKNEMREFSNNCDLQRTICETNQKWRIIKQGTCFTDNSSKDPDCPRFCTDDYQPVCAEFNEEQREFANKCELLRTICETNKKWELVKLGTCSKHTPLSLRISTTCPKSCTREFDPVCAKLNNELREFSNKCVLESLNCESDKKWEIVNNGTCSSGSAALLSSPASCPKFCTREYMPVCAQFENEFREFPNKCELLRENCETDKDWELIKSGTCSSVSTCPKFCTREFDPVCAKFENELREFSNKCELLRISCELGQNWEIVNSGTCPSNSLKCPKFCTREYIPVCAQFNFELREFPNKCDLERENCESDKTWEIVNSGPCSSNTLRTLSPISTCPEFCTEEYRPVCAEFESELREFGNKCDLQRTICKTNNNWSVVNEGPCPSQTELKSPCPKICTKDFRPVCARFKGKLREFPNKCEFQRTRCETNIDWKLVNSGPCPIKTFKADNIELQPICATNGEVNKIFNNSSELQEEIRKTGIAWSLLHNDDCPPSNPCENEALDPICAISDVRKLKTFNNLCQMSEEIKNTGKDWSILHQGACSTSTIPTITFKESTTAKLTTKTSTEKAAAKAFSLTTDSTTKKSTTKSTTESTTAKTTKSTTFRTTEIPKTTTTQRTTDKPRTTTILKTTATPRIISQKTTPKLSTTAQPRTSTKTTTTLKPIFRTTTTKTITATTTTPKTTTTAHSKYSSTDSTPTHDHNIYDHSTEDDTAEIDESSKEYYEEHVSYCGCSSHEDNVSYSTENVNDGTDNSWEDEEEDEKEDAFESNSPYIIESDTYSYKHNDTNSTYTFIYGKDSTKSDEGNYASDRLSEESVNQKVISSNVEYTRHDNSEKKYSQSNNGLLGENNGREKESKIKQGMSKLGHLGEAKQIQDSIPSSNKNLKDRFQSNLKKASNNHNLGSVKQHVKALADNKVKNVGPSIKQSNQQDLKKQDNNEGKNLVKLIQERISEVFGSQQADDRSEKPLNNGRILNTKPDLEIKPMGEQLSLDSNKNYENLIENFHSPDDSLEANISYEEDPPQVSAYTPQETQSYLPPLINENQPKFGVHSDEAYGLMDAPSQPNEPQYKTGNFHNEINSNNKINAFNSANIDQDKQILVQNEEIPEYSSFNSASIHQYDQIFKQNEQIPEYSAVNSHSIDQEHQILQNEEIPEYSSFNSASIHQDDQILKQNEQIPEYSNTQSHINNTADAEHVLQVFEALLSESDAEEEDDETLVNQVLTTMEGQTTVAYPTYEESENQLNHTKREEYPSKYNSTNAKKGEIYNGAVYKAPVYDAPTYNFIYTAPNHPVLPLMPQNNPFLNYPGFLPNYGDPSANQYNPFVPMSNQSNLAGPAESVPGVNSHFNPLQFLTSLAAMGNHFGAPIPNIMPVNPATEYADDSLTSNSNQLDADNNPSLIDYNQSKLPLNPSNPPVYNHILPQTHPSPQMFLPPPPEKFLNSFSPINSIASQIPNILPPKQQPEENQQNLNNPAAPGNNESNQSLYPFPALPVPMYNHPVNPQLQQPQPLHPPVAPNGWPNYSFQPPLPYIQQPSPLQFPPPAGPLPFNAFNATLINQIAETLKIITSRY